MAIVVIIVIVVNVVKVVNVEDRAAEKALRNNK